jgi:hypothetical protein
MNMTSTGLRNLSILAVLLTAVTAIGQQNAAPPAEGVAAQSATTQAATTQPAIEAKADELVHKMSEQLAKLSAFRLEAEILFDQLSPDGQKIQYSNRFTVAQKRPDQLIGELTGDMPGRRFWYDGRELVTLDSERNVYSVVPVTGTVDAMLDHTMERYGWTIPLSDLLLSNAHEALTGEAQSGRYVGLHRVGEFKCHHLAFTQDDLDWQIWIDDDEQALPRKLVIDYRSLPGSPQFSAVIVKWDTKPELKADDFKFEPPPGATKIDMLPVEPEQQD